MPTRQKPPPEETACRIPFRRCPTTTRPWRRTSTSRRCGSITTSTIRRTSIGSMARSRARSGPTRRSRMSSATSSKIPEDKRGVVRNHGGGHLNHTLFWNFMSPKGGGAPSGDLAARDRRQVRLVRRLQGDVQGRRHQPVRLGLGLARQGRGRPRGRLDCQSGQSGHGRQGAAARRRRLGARLLPELPEPPSGLPRRLVERGRLGGRRTALRRVAASSAKSEEKCQRRRRGGEPQLPRKR